MTESVRVLPVVGTRGKSWQLVNAQGGLIRYLDGEKCFACGKALGRPTLVDTRDGQTVYVGRECIKKVMAAGPEGWQPPKGGPRLFPLKDNS